MTDPTGRDPDRRSRADDYHQARIGAAAALVAVLILVLILDPLVPAYDADPITVAALLGTIAALVGVEWRAR